MEKKSLKDVSLVGYSAGVEKDAGAGSVFEFVGWKMMPLSFCIAAFTRSRNRPGACFWGTMLKFKLASKYCCFVTSVESGSPPSEFGARSSLNLLDFSF